MEGEERDIFRLHIAKERNPELIRRAKKRALLLGNEHIRCECCSFDFVENYGIHGEGFIECHHKIPIATGFIRFNRVEDLALVCANCHRMLHWKNQFGGYYTIEELSAILNDNGNV